MADPQLLIDQLESGTLSILIVDDDLNIISGLKDILDDSGYTVEVAYCAAEARELLARKTFSTMITDYSLPDDNGIQLAAHAKKWYPSLGLILMTGHDHAHIREKINEEEIKFLRKPVEVALLLSVIENTIQLQCEALNIQRPEIPVAVAAEPAAPVSPLPEQEVAWAPEFTVRRNWTLPAACFAIALIGFGTGWFSRGLGRDAARGRPQSDPAGMHVDPVAEMKLAPPLDAVPVVVEMKKRAPKLVAQLSHDNPSVRIKAAKALLKTNPEHPQATAVLLARLADPNAKQRLAAIEALSTAGTSTSEVISKLARALRDPDPSVANAAASALGNLGKDALPAVGALIEAMNYNVGSFPSVTESAKRAITGIGEPARPALNSALADPKIKQHALDVLARMKPPADNGSAVLSQNRAPMLDPLALDDLPGSDDTQAASAPVPISTSVR